MDVVCLLNSETIIVSFQGKGDEIEARLEEALPLLIDTTLALLLQYINIISIVI